MTPEGKNKAEGGPLLPLDQPPSPSPSPTPFDTPPMEIHTLPHQQLLGVLPQSWGVPSHLTIGPKRFKIHVIKG